MSSAILLSNKDKEKKSTTKDTTEVETNDDRKEKKSTTKDTTEVEKNDGRKEKVENVKSSTEDLSSEDRNIQAAIELSLQDNVDGGVKVEKTSDLPQTKERQLIDQIKGVLYGNCIGDAIGLLTEFMNKREAEEYYNSDRLMNVFNTRDLEYNQKKLDSHRCNWENGDWTDDSDQMILILRTLVQNKGEFKEKDFAKKLLHWVYHGYEELGDHGGCGLGRTTASVLSYKHFSKDPHKAARAVWEGSGRFIAPNGGVMRTSVLGTMKFNDLDKVIENTRNACKVTHADPRCIASCIAVTIAIALMLQRKYVTSNGEHDVDKIMEICYSYAEKEIEDKQHKKELKEHMFAKSLDKLELDSSSAIGYTLKCMGAGFWAFKQKDFREAIQAITMEAGDADTNCAVAGALLGCKVGFKNLPESWVKGLCYRKWLDNEIKSYLTLLGLEE